MNIELKKEEYLLGFFIGDGHAPRKEKKELRFFIEPQLFREIKRILRRHLKMPKLLATDTETKNAMR
jgi:hypothetical protein